MPRELVQARADPDTVQGIEDYAEERDISQSEAIRRLLREGLEADEEEEEEEEESESEEYAVANMNATVRTAGGVVLGLLVFVLILIEIGVL
jgi:hypothetical protein